MRITQSKRPGLDLGAQTHELRVMFMIFHNMLGQNTERAYKQKFKGNY